MKIAAMLHGSMLTMGKLSNHGRQQGVDEVPHRLNAMARFLQTLPRALSRHTTPREPGVFCLNCFCSIIWEDSRSSVFTHQRLSASRGNYRILQQWHAVVELNEIKEVFQVKQARSSFLHRRVFEKGVKFCYICSHSQPQLRKAGT